MTWAIVVETHAKKKLQREHVTRRAKLVMGFGSWGAASSSEPFLGGVKSRKDLHGMPAACQGLYTSAPPQLSLAVIPEDKLPKLAEPVT